MPDLPDMCSTICYVVESNVSESCLIWRGWPETGQGEGAARGNHFVLFADLALRTAIAILSIRFLFIYSIHILKWPSKIRTFIFEICQLAVIKIYYNLCTCVCVCACVWVCQWIDRSECFVYTQMVTRKSAVHCEVVVVMFYRHIDYILCGYNDSV